MNDTHSLPRMNEDRAQYVRNEIAVAEDAIRVYEADKGDCAYVFELTRVKLSPIVGDKAAERLTSRLSVCRRRARGVYVGYRADRNYRSGEARDRLHRLVRELTGDNP